MDLKLVSKSKSIMKTYLDKYTDLEIIQSYVKRLFIFLHFYCFTSGSFVIQDNDEILFNLLNNVDEKYVVNLHTPFITHNVFFTSTSQLKEIHMSSHPIDINCNPRKEGCAGKIAIFRNLKWYQFIPGESRNKYIFLKPEKSAQSFSSEHAKHKGSMMAFGAPEKDCILSRREDCTRRGYSCNSKSFFSIDGSSYRMYKEVKIYSNISNWKKYDIIENLKRVDYYTRVGDEAYIIQPVSDFIISTILERKPFQIFDVGPYVISIRNFNVEIGGTKNKTIRKKKSHKKSHKKSKRYYTFSHLKR